MTSVNPLDNSTYIEKLLASQSTATAQGANPANNAFAALFQSILDGSAPAESTASTVSGTQSTPSGSNSLEQVLAGGNLSAAQLAFQSLEMDPSRKAHHHHPNGDAAATIQASSTATTGSTAVTPVASTMPADLLNLLIQS